MANDYSKPPYAYRLEAIYPSAPGESGMVTACVMDCMLSGKMLSGSGGGGNYISPEVYEILLSDKEVRALIRQKLIDAAGTSS